LISSKRHTETDPKTGKNVYIIETYLRDQDTRKITDVKNTEYSGVRFKVRFHRGTGRTISRLKAQYFSEFLEYQVTLHKDEEPWFEANAPKRDFVEIIDEDSDYTIDDVDDDFEDIE
jgi:hypothetical protein